MDFLWSLGEAEYGWIQSISFQVEDNERYMRIYDREKHLVEKVSMLPLGGSFEKVGMLSLDGT